MTVEYVPKSSLEGLDRLASEEFIGISDKVCRRQTHSLNTILSGFMYFSDAEERFLEILDSGLTERDSVHDIEYARALCLFDYWMGAQEKVFEETGEHVKLFIDQNQTYDVADLYTTMIQLHNIDFQEDFNGRIKKLTEFLTEKTENKELVQKLKIQLESLHYNPAIRRKNMNRQYDNEKSVHDKVKYVISELNTRLNDLRREN